MELCSIASGSSGNCIYVGNQDTKLLVDAGISCKRIENGLTEIDIDPRSINGILITHEHSDHIMGVGVLARRYKTPIFGTVETFSAMSRNKNLGKIDPTLFHIIEPDKSFFIQDVQVNPFRIPHDAANPVAYTLESEGHKIGIATDLGNYNDYIIENLKNSEILLLEANHDINMLQVGAYPYVLKRRILGELGHLSNDNCGRLINSLLWDKMKHIYLGHLSKENNYPELAYETVKYELDQLKSPYKDVKIEVANREMPSALCRC